MAYRTQSVNRLHKTARNVRHARVCLTLDVVRHVHIMCTSFSYSLAPTRRFALVNHNQAQFLITLHAIFKGNLHSLA
jgi:hypothetical protein